MRKQYFDYKNEVTSMLIHIPWFKTGRHGNWSLQIVIEKSNKISTNLMRKLSENPYTFHISTNENREAIIETKMLEKERRTID